MSNLDLPPTFKNGQKEEIKKKIEELKNKLIQFEKDNSCTIVPTLIYDNFAIRPDIKVIPNDMIKGDR